MEGTNKPIGEVVREYREREGLTQRQLGERLGIKQEVISQIETGRRKLGAAQEEAFRKRFGGNESDPTPAPGTGRSAEVLLAEITAARQEMGRPITMEEAEALAGMETGELLSQSILLREALEVQASRELLAGAKAFRKKREAAQRGA